MHEQQSTVNNLEVLDSRFVARFENCRIWLKNSAGKTFAIDFPHYRAPQVVSNKNRLENISKNCSNRALAIEYEHFVHFLPKHNQYFRLKSDFPLRISGKNRTKLKKPIMKIRRRYPKLRLYFD